MIKKITSHRPKCHLMLTGKVLYKERKVLQITGCRCEWEITGCRCEWEITGGRCEWEITGGRCEWEITIIMIERALSIILNPHQTNFNNIFSNKLHYLDGKMLLNRRF